MLEKVLGPNRDCSCRVCVEDCQEQDYRPVWGVDKEEYDSFGNPVNLPLLNVNRRMFLDQRVPEWISDDWLEVFEDIYWAMEFAVGERKHPAGRIQCEFSPMTQEGILWIDNDIKAYLGDDLEVVYDYKHYGIERTVRGLTPDQFSKIIE